MSDKQRASKRTNRRPNRAQRRAMAVRQAESSVPAPLDMSVALSEEALAPADESAPAVARTRTARRQAQAPAYVLPRATEYAYIHADLRRLLITAAILLALMFGLLFVIG